MGRERGHPVEGVTRLTPEISTRISPLTFDRLGRHTIIPVKPGRDFLHGRRGYTEDADV